MKKKKYNIVMEETDTGWSAYIDELSVYTTGRSVQETLINLSEALDLYFSSIVETINPPY